MTLLDFKGRDWEWKPLPDNEVLPVMIMLRFFRIGGHDINGHPMPEQYAFCRKTLITPPEGLDAPDGTGWWAFEGSELGSEAIWPDDYDPDNEEDDHDFDDDPVSPIGYRDILKEPFQAVFEVRWVKVGQAFTTRRCSGPYDGPERVLGYVNPKRGWSPALCGLDNLQGKWTRVSLPWDKEDQQLTKL